MDICHSAPSSAGVSVQKNSNESHLNTNALSGYIRYVKLATALAIIRSRPSNMTGETYAQQLCGQFQKSQLYWMSRADVLQRQVLRLQQQLVMTHFQGSEHSETKESEKDILEGSEYLFPTPPCSSEEIKGIPLQSHSTELYEHVSFLSSMLALKSAARSDLAKFQVRSTVQESLDRTLEVLQKWLCESQGHQLSATMLQYALDTLVQLVTNTDKLGCHTLTVEKAMQEFVQCIIVAIMEQNNPLEFEKTERQRHCLVSLGRCQRLSESMLEAFCHCVCHCGHLLRQSRDGRTLIPPHILENIYHVLWIMEQILLFEKSARVDGWPERRHTHALSCTVLLKLNHKLEDSLLHISDIFPTFAHYIWQIVVLIQSLVPADQFEMENIQLS